MTDTVRIGGTGIYAEPKRQQAIALLVTAAVTFCAQPETFPIFSGWVARHTPDVPPLTPDILAEFVRSLE